MLFFRYTYYGNFRFAIVLQRAMSEFGTLSVPEPRQCMYGGCYFNLSFLSRSIYYQRNSISCILDLREKLTKVYFGCHEMLIMEF